MVEEIIIKILILQVGIMFGFLLGILVMQKEINRMEVESLKASSQKPYTTSYGWRISKRKEK